MGPRQRGLGVGGGRGGAVARMRERGIDAVGIDFSTAMIELALRRHGMGDWVRRADADDLPFARDSFEVVITDGLLHHLAVQGRLQGALSESGRVLRPGGRLCCFDRSGSMMSNFLLRISVGTKELLRRATGGERYPSSATRNEISFGGRKDMDSICGAGFNIRRRRSIATAPFFMSVVVLNSVQYFLTKRLRESIEPRLCRVIMWLDAIAGWSWLSVEQLVVFESTGLSTAAAPSIKEVAYTSVPTPPAPALLGEVL